jgi:hypothetical protein
LNFAASGIKPEALSRHELGEEIFAKLTEVYEAKEKILGAATMRYHERMVMLSVIDGLWKDHLLSMDHLKEGINLRGYAQRDPLVEYKRESFELFEAMMLKFQEDTVRFLFRMQIIGPDGQPMDAAPGQRRATDCRRRRAAGDRDPYAQTLHDYRRAGEGVPPQEGAGTCRGQPARRRRLKPAFAAPDGRKGRAQRSLSLWQRQEIQEMSRSRELRDQRTQISELKGCGSARCRRVSASPLPAGVARSLPLQRRKRKKPFFPFFSGSKPAAVLAIWRIVCATDESPITIGVAVSRVLRAAA